MWETVTSSNCVSMHVVNDHYNERVMNQPLYPSSGTPVLRGRFFAVGDGRVGQYLSPRVLVVRTPFKKAPRRQDACYFGFEKLSQAQKFAQYLASFGYPFSLQRSQILTQLPYEIKLQGNADIVSADIVSADIVSVLAYWDRLDQRRLASTQQEAPAA
jgi:hypothetical protein